MTELKLYKTTNKGLKIITMSIPFILIGIWMINKEPFGTTHYVMGWICTFFFGLGLLIGLFQTFDKRPQIIINENGIWDRTTRQDEIKWEQIIKAYPVDIYGQKFISLVTDDTFVVKKKLNKWTSKLNKYIGVQNLNLQLGQININENQLTDLINKLSGAEKEERKILIQSFRVDRTNFSILGLQRVILYVFTSISLLLISLTGITAFMTIMILMGIAALTARWYWGSPDNSKVRKYAETMTWLGLVNMVLCLLTIEVYDYTTENIGLKISKKIEEYYYKFNTYPKNLDSIKNDLNFNFVQRHFADKIEYKVFENDFELQLKNLFDNDRIYDTELNEWE